MLTFLAKPLIGQIAAPIAVILAVCLGVQSVKLHLANGRIDKLELAVKAAEADLSRCQDNRKLLSTKLDEQNAAVAALKDEADARQAESAKALSQARKSAEKARADAQRILAAKPAVADRCEAAARLIAEVG